MQYLHTMTGVTVVQANVTLPATSPDAYTSALNSALETYGSRVKMVIFSHISSVPALIEPIEALATLTKRVAPHAAVLVDGAHALGHINVNIPNLAAAGVDFWLGNGTLSYYEVSTDWIFYFYLFLSGHKWLYSPKGSCVLWVSDAFRDWTSGHGVIPNIISGLGEFTSEFAETGTHNVLN
jgi:selenocysteine lyase/cysteine desulfurase